MFVYATGAFSPTREASTSISDNSTASEAKAKFSDELAPPTMTDLVLDEYPI